MVHVDLAWVIVEFEEGNMYLNANEKCTENVCLRSLAALTERLGNPFEEECLIYWCSTQSNLMILQLLKLDPTKTIDET